ncbi:MAG: hypothetical protein HC780_05770 [Leptolyngbyaceae cyanobacterium CSU_1_3]|nr:hypothetical protein [Leptolyngbyaceae cyanobacterium CSU_1_3]
MPQNSQSSPWQFDAQATYTPISFEGTIVGFCKADAVKQVVSTLNNAEKLQKALALACYDLIAREGGNTDSVGELAQQYLNKIGRPLHGTALIALLLKERQAELDLSPDEFAKFCDSYRLSRLELRQIYNGEEIESQQLSPLARILGKTIDEVINLWQESDP